MKRVVYVVFICAMLLSFSTLAYSDGSNYITPFVGATLLSEAELDDSALPGTILNITYDPGYAAALAIGHDFGHFRVEGELNYQYNDADKASINGGPESDVNYNVTLFALFCNAYFDFVADGAVSPYIMAGIGRGTLSVENYSGNDQDVLFAYQAGAGMGIRVTDSLTIDLRYRYLKTDTAYLGTAHLDYAGHSGLIGLRFKF